MISRSEAAKITGTQQRVPVTVSSTSSLESFNPISNTETESAIDAILSNSSRQYSFPEASFSIIPVANPMTAESGIRTRTDAGSMLPSSENVRTMQVPQSGVVPKGLKNFSGFPLQALVPIMPATPSAPATPIETNSNTVAEFLFQLTKMLTDNNKEIIEWTNGKIEVHNPHKLASEVLHKYFRHSKFASFQRQLNYFGFRKLAGKGKMSPCSYVNEATTMDYKSILAIKRKTTTTIQKEKVPKKRERSGSNTGHIQVSTNLPVDPVLVGILHRTTAESGPCEPKRERLDDSTSVTTIKVAVGKGIKHQLNGFLRNPPENISHLALAKIAVGKGVRHSVSAQNTLTEPSVVDATTADNSFTFKEPHQLGMDVQSSLDELSNNFRNSLKQSLEIDDQAYISMLRRDDSLVDLAMIPSVEPTSVSEMQEADAAASLHIDSSGMAFLDFPDDDSMDPI